MSKENKGYFCKCYKVTKDEVKQYIKDGVTSYKELQQLTKVGTKCSSCKTKTKEKFKKYKNKLST